MSPYSEHFEQVPESVSVVSGDLFGTCAPIETLTEVHNDTMPILDELVSLPFFRSYKINMEKECPFWAQKRLCNTNKCDVCECDEKEIPNFWRMQREVSQPDFFVQASSLQMMDNGGFMGNQQMIME
mmetsp:Transcript_65575/g.90666  ORF Transcript_65575/g.90666 Transcript_65575/m.90666 type:complete len:127 (+) Transcript_65575:109-489(+)